jgi:hypothetical protein
MAKATIIESVKDSLYVGSNLIENAKNEIVWLLPPAMVALLPNLASPTNQKL